MTVAVLLMAAVPGQQRLAAQEAGDGVLQKVGNEPGEQDGEPGSRVNRMENLGLVVKMNRVKCRSRAWVGPAESRAA